MQLLQVDLKSDSLKNELELPDLIEGDIVNMHGNRLYVVHCTLSAVGCMGGSDS